MSDSNPPEDDSGVEARFRLKYADERAALSALTTVGIGPSEHRAIKTLELIAQTGLAAVLRRRPASREDVLALVAAFLADGAASILNVGAQRGGDFLTNQLRGRWAEDVAMSMALPGVTLLRFGPSGAAMPGEEDHRRVIGTFRQIQLLEGKRPDLLAFRTDAWRLLTEAQRRRAETWPERLMTKDDDGIVRAGLCGLEVKNSTWHYESRRRARGGRLSITVKDEELAMLADWSRGTTLPVLFVQVLFDEIYCMNFLRMQRAIERRQLYAPGDYISEPGAGGKLYHRFLIDGPPHLVGKVAFPNESEAHVKVLADGSVVPYIEMLPATALDVDGAAFHAELGYA